MIECVSDEPHLHDRYTELAKAILSESNSKNIVHMFIDIELKEGFFLVSVDIKGKQQSMRIADCGEFEVIPEGFLFHLEPTQESRLPQIVRMMRERIGRDEVAEKSRFDILVSGGDPESIGTIVIDEPTDDLVENTMTILELLSPEGFKITRTLISGMRMTLLCSQYILKDAWVQKMVDVHNRPSSS